MTQTIWQAFYYDNPEGTQAPVRCELLEAETECAALAIARQHAGQAKRIEVASPHWGEQPTRVIQTGELNKPA